MSVHWLVILLYVLNLRLMEFELVALPAAMVLRRLRGLPSPRNDNVLGELPDAPVVEVTTVTAIRSCPNSGSSAGAVACATSSNGCPEQNS